jgi:hypothetical protein
MRCYVLASRDGLHPTPVHQLFVYVCHVPLEPIAALPMRTICIEENAIKHSDESSEIQLRCSKVKLGM